MPSQPILNETRKTLDKKELDLQRRGLNQRQKLCTVYHYAQI
jgi:hypothetical protein